MNSLRIGSLFSGAGGLDMAVEHVFGATTAWHCEVDPAASKVLAHRWPGVLNIGDITKVDWERGTCCPDDGWDLEAPLYVDILCGGYPCQPFSAAGQRKGTNDERHLWPYFAEAIRCLRPRYVVLENVAGHRSMGFDRVLADLAGIGYDSQWCSVRASDVGAPHRRERVFVLATDTDKRRRGGLIGSSRTAQATEPEALTGASRTRPSWSARIDLLPTPAACRSGNNQSTSPGAAVRPSLDMIAALLPTPTTQDGPNCAGPPQFEPNSLPLNVVATLLPTPQARDAAGAKTPEQVIASGNPWNLNDYVVNEASNWGKYEAAIRRWETLTRPAPPPTEPNTKGNPRLSARFSEWMLGWPDGWVTDIPSISRNDALRIIGNGVCVQQCVAALHWLLSVMEIAA